jgi:phosphoribosylglycinamide formyltransferase-1
VTPEDTPDTLAAKIHLLEKEHFPRVIDETIKARK